MSRDRLLSICAPRRFGFRASGFWFSLLSPGAPQGVAGLFWGDIGLFYIEWCRLLLGRMQVSFAHLLGDAEVDELELLVHHQEVGRLQVAVHHALLVHHLQQPFVSKLSTRFSCTTCSSPSSASFLTSKQPDITLQRVGLGPALGQQAFSRLFRRAL